MPEHRVPRVAVEPPGSPPWLVEAVEQGGGTVVEPAEATTLVWSPPDQGSGLADLLRAHPHLDWVQLPWAGIEPYVGVLDHDRRWTCGKGVYADPVAEHALALLLAGLRNVVGYARADRWGRPAGTNLLDADVVILGGGGIGEVLVGLLQPFRARVTIVRRHQADMPGVARVVGPDQLDDVLPTADAVVLALAATPSTRGIIGARQLDLMAGHAWLVNVARGAHVDTDALVAALAARSIGGAALDVTDPEPLPDGHPLWSEPRCVITPHTANTPAMARPLLAARVAENVRRYAAGEPLIGPVDPDLGY